jgi:hypothetical protein
MANVIASANCELWRRLITPFHTGRILSLGHPGNKLPGYHRSVPPGQTSAVGINNRRLLTTLPDRSGYFGDQCGSIFIGNVRFGDKHNDYETARIRGH